jgi:hypothetical protein
MLRIRQPQYKTWMRTCNGFMQKIGIALQTLLPRAARNAI